MKFVLSKREILYCCLLLCGNPKGFTSFENKSVTSITVLVESLLNALIGKCAITGSKLEFSTASCTGRESAATTCEIPYVIILFCLSFPSEVLVHSIFHHQNQVRMLF